MVVLSDFIQRMGTLSMVQKRENKDSHERDGINIHIDITLIKKIAATYILPIVLSITASFIYDNFTMAGVKESLNEINTRLIAIENSNNNTNDININIHSLKPTVDGSIDVNYLVASTDNSKIYIAESPSSNVEKLFMSVTDMTMCSIDSPSWKLSDEIAVDTETEKVYTAEELINRKVLFPYKLENQECFFLGQFNENNQWDGHCIINIYENDDLKLIMEAEYSNGNLLSYKQVFQSRNGNCDVWSFSDRINKENYTSGKTWSYLKITDFKKAFEYNNITSEDILDVEKFELIVKDNGLEEYYYGETANGYFNDFTGNAYLVKYSDDGTIKMLYVGNFKDGMPDDDTGNAWEILFDGSNDINKYFYYKGSFKNNQREGKVSADNYVTQEEINEIIKGMTFNCELNWYDES